MNSACLLYIINYEVIDENTEFPPVYYLTYNFDGDNNYGICGFDKHNEMIDDTEVSFDTYEEIMAHVQSLTNIKMLSKSKLTKLFQWIKTKAVNS